MLIRGSVVGSECDREPGIAGEQHRSRVRSGSLVDPCPQCNRQRAGVDHALHEAVDAQRRYERHPALGGSAGLVIAQEDPVLDAQRARLDRVVDGFPAPGVHHHTGAHAIRPPHRVADLSSRECGFEARARGRTYPRRAVELHPLRAALEHLCDRAVESPGGVGVGAVDDPHRELHPRPAGLRDGSQHARLEPAGVSHAGESGGQCCGERPLGRGESLLFAQLRTIRTVEGVPGGVQVGVDEARYQPQMLGMQR